MCQLISRYKKEKIQVERGNDGEKESQRWEILGFEMHNGKQETEALKKAGCGEIQGDQTPDYPDESIFSSAPVSKANR